MWAEQQLRWWHQHSDSLKRPNQFVSSFFQTHFHHDDNICPCAVTPGASSDHAEGWRRRVISGYRRRPGISSDCLKEARGYWMFGRGLRISFPVCKIMEIRRVLTVLHKMSGQEYNEAGYKRIMNSHRHRTCCILLKPSDSGQQYWRMSRMWTGKQQNLNSDESSAISQTFPVCSTRFCQCLGLDVWCQCRWWILTSYSHGTNITRRPHVI